MVVCFLVFEPLLEILLQLGIGKEGVALLACALGIQGDELLRHIAHGLFHAGARFLPFGAAELVQVHVSLLARADVFRNEIELRNGDVKDIPFRIANLDIILGNALHFELMDALEHADAVRSMHHIIAPSELLQPADALGVLRPRAALLARFFHGLSV